MNDRSTRRQFIDRTCRWIGFTTIGGAAGLLACRATASAVYQVDPSKCTSCDLCRTSCVLSLSAVKAVNDFAKCGYCMLCPAYMDVASKPDERGVPTGRAATLC